MFAAHFSIPFEIIMALSRKDKGSHVKQGLIKAFKSLVFCLVVKVFPLLLHP